jgi:hypothetical protein
MDLRICTKMSRIPSTEKNLQERKRLWIYAALRLPYGMGACYKFAKREDSDGFVYLRIPEEEILFRKPGSLLAALPDPVRGHDISEQGTRR